MKFLELINQIYSTKVNAQNNAENIKAHWEWSDQKRLLEIGTIYDEANKTLADLSQAAEDALGTLIAYVQEHKQKIALEDNAFLNAVNLMKTAGEAVPDDVQRQLIDKFQYNKDALTILKNISGVSEAGIACEEYLSRIEKSDLDIQSLSDQIYYNGSDVNISADHLNPADIEQRVNEYLAAYGLSYPG